MGVDWIKFKLKGDVNLQELRIWVERQSQNFAFSFGYLHRIEGANDDLLSLSILGGSRDRKSELLRRIFSRFANTNGNRHSKRCPFSRLRNTPQFAAVEVGDNSIAN